MDFSKLSNEELIALKNKDYSKLSDTALLALKGNKTKKKPSLISKMTDAYDQYKQSPLYMASPQGMLEKTNELVRKGFDVGGEKTTEELAARGANPYVAAGLGTAVQMAPDIAMSFAAPRAPIKSPEVLKNAAKGLGAQLESASGSVPGSLNAAYNEAGLILEKGTSAAKPLYEAAKSEFPSAFKNVRGLNPFKGLYKPDEIVDAAKIVLDKGGKLEPSEALTARKAVDKLLRKKEVVADELIPLRETLDELAKASKNIAKADPMHQRGRMAESLRNVIAQNKYGGASAFKMGIYPALAGLGGFVGGPVGAGIGAAVASGLLSPAVQGVAATGAGIAGRNIVPIAANPASAVTALNALDRLAKSRKKKK